jgi:hypothetical protein
MYDYYEDPFNPFVAFLCVLAVIGVLVVGVVFVSGAGPTTRRRRPNTSRSGRLMA